MSEPEGEPRPPESQRRSTARLPPYARRPISPWLRLALFALRIYTIAAIAVVIVVFVVSLRR